MCKPRWPCILTSSASPYWVLESFISATYHRLICVIFCVWADTNCFSKDGFSYIAVKMSREGQMEGFLHTDKCKNRSTKRKPGEFQQPRYGTCFPCMSCHPDQSRLISLNIKILYMVVLWAKQKRKIKKQDKILITHTTKECKVQMEETKCKGRNTHMPYSLNTSTKQQCSAERCFSSLD